MFHPRLGAAVLACAFAALSVTAAEAKQHPKGHDCASPLRMRVIASSDEGERPAIAWTCRHVRSALRMTRADDEFSASRRHHRHHGRHHAHHRGAANGRPGAWCGWYMRQLLGVADPSFNLARRWASFGRPAGGPCVGCLVVWHHHVGKIVGRADNGQWIVHSGNDGNAVRTRPRSVAGAVFRLPG